MKTKIISITIALTGFLLIVTHLSDADMVLAKAARICLECVGIG